MNTLEKKTFYRRNLPHYHLAGSEYFITVHLAWDWPFKAKQKEYSLRQIDDFLDTTQFGPRWLKNPEIAQLVWDALLFRDEKVYSLHAATIMPNHFHIVFKHLVEPRDGHPLKNSSLQGIMHSLKRKTSSDANAQLGLQGAFWQAESYDRLIRDRNEWDRAIYYVIMNPVKAGLVTHWQDWPWTYCKFARPGAPAKI